MRSVQVINSSATEKIGQIKDIVECFCMPGVIRKTQFFEDTQTYHFDISGNKFCSRANRIHNRNNCYYRYNLNSNILEHGCYSFKCQGKLGFQKVITL